MAEHTSEQATKTSDQSTKTELDARNRVLKSDLVIDSFSTVYHAPKIFKDVQQVIDHITPGFNENMWSHQQTFDVDEVIQLTGTLTDYGKNQDITRFNGARFGIVSGANPNVGDVTIHKINDLEVAVAHVKVYGHAHGQDSDQNAMQQYFNRPQMDEVNSELRRSLNPKPGETRKSLYPANTDPTGWVFSLLQRLTAHNSAVRYDPKTRNIMTDEEHSTASTMLSWPLALEASDSGTTVMGGWYKHGDDEHLDARSVLNTALSMLAASQARIVQVTIHDAAVAVTYNTTNNPADIGPRGQVFATDAPNADGGKYHYYVERQDDNRIWLHTCVTTLFRNCGVHTAGSDTEVPMDGFCYYATELQDMQAEARFLLSKGRGNAALAPSHIGSVEQLYSKSIGKDRLPYLAVNRPDDTSDWKLRKRELVVATLALLRGYGVRNEQYYHAATKLGAVIGSTYILGDRNGAIAVPAVELHLPSVMTYGVQNLRITNVYGIAAPLDLGLARNFVNIPILLGITTSLLARMWVASLITNAGTLDIGSGTNVLDAIRAHKTTTYVHPNAKVTDRRPMTELAADSWMPGRAAAAYLASADGQGLDELASIIAGYDAEAPAETALVRVSFGAKQRPGQINNLTDAVTANTRNEEMHFINGTTVKQWVKVPKTIDSVQNPLLGIGDTAAILTPDTKTVVKKHKCEPNSQAAEAVTGSLTRTRIAFANQVGTSEHAIMSALNAAKMDHIQATKWLQDNGAQAHSALMVPVMMAYLIGTPDGKITAAGTRDEAQRNRLVISGNPLMSTLPGIAAMMAGMNINNTDSVALPSSVATSAEALRQAALSGELHVEMVTVNNPSKQARIEGRDEQLLTISPQRSITRQELNTPTTHGTSFDPTGRMIAMMAPVLYSVATESRPATYTQPNTDVTAGPIDESADDIDELAARQTIKDDNDVYACNIAFTHHSAEWSSAGGLDGLEMELVPSLTSTGVQVEATSETDSTIAPRASKLDIIVNAAPTAVRLMAELLLTGVPVAAQRALRKLMLDRASREDGVVLRGKTEVLNKAMNRAAPDAPANLSDVTRDASELGIVLPSTASTALGMAAYICDGMKTFPKELKSALVHTPSVASLRELEQRAEDLRLRGKAMTDTAALATALADWLPSTDPLIKDLVLETMHSIAIRLSDTEPTRCFTYRVQGGAEVRPSVKRFIDIMEGKADATEDLPCEVQNLDPNVSDVELLFLPAVAINDTIFSVWQVVGNITNASDEDTRELDWYEKAFSLGAQFDTGEAYDGLAATREAFDNHNLGQVSDARALAYNTDHELHRAINQVATMHLLHTGKLWVASCDYVDAEDDAYRRYERVMRPLIKELIGGIGGGYRVRTHRDHELRFLRPAPRQT
ncbi:coat protein subunit p1 [Rugonectria rugulosa quadrivirus 1]|nr:coat protein subunit p1 [Rugonectria rugulosa quadrivirus 1]